MSEPEPSPPTCYRHPERETYIRCARCDRPICPDCMVSAAVGFQCPDDAREGTRSVRQPRTLFGGRFSQDPAYLSKGLIGLTVLVFLVQQVSGFLVLSRFALVSPAVAAGEWYRLLTAALLHGDLVHLLFNMYALYLFGPPLEAALGRLRFLALYVLSALGGSALSYALNPTGISVGASGAIFGLFAASLVMNQRLGRESTSLWILLAINLGLGFVLPNIDWRAHVGGLLTGAAVAAVLVYAPRRRRVPVQLAGCLMVLLVVLVVVSAGSL